MPNLVFETAVSSLVFDAGFQSFGFGSNELTLQVIEGPTLSGFTNIDGILLETDVFQSLSALGSTALANTDTAFALNSDGSLEYESGFPDPMLTSLVVDASVTWEDSSLSDIDASVARDTLIDIWSPTADAPTEQRIQFLISSVPEPSSTTLLGLGGLSLLMRRRR